MSTPIFSRSARDTLTRPPRNHAIGDPEIALLREEPHLRLGRETIDVTVAAGDGEWRAAGNDARAGDISVIDGIAKIYGSEGRRADVADGSESGEQRDVGVANGVKSSVEGC